MMQSMQRNMPAADGKPEAVTNQEAEQKSGQAQQMRQSVANKIQINY